MRNELAHAAGRQAASAALSIHVLIACWLGMVFDGMDASIYVLTLHPSLSELLNTASATEIGWHGAIVMAVFMLGWTVGAIGFGMAADYIGRVRTLMVTVLLYAICTGLCATSHSWQELAFYRFLVGCGIGGEISIGGVMLAEFWKGKARLHATGIMQTGFSCGVLLLAAANLVIGHFGWRWLYVLGILPALLAIYVRLKLDDPQDFKAVRAERRRLKGAGREGLAGADSRLLRSPFVQLFSRENLARTVVVVILASTACIGTYAVISWIPAWVNQLTGTLAVAERSYTVMARDLGAILAAATGGIFVLWLGRRNAFRMAFTGALVSCIAMFLTVKAFGTGLFAWAFVVGFFVLAPYTYLFIYVPELFDTRLRATAFGFSIQLGRIFAGIAALIGGQLIGLFGGSYARACACVSLVYIVGLVATFFMPHSDGVVRLEMDSEGEDADEPLKAPAAAGTRK